MRWGSQGQPNTGFVAWKDFALLIVLPSHPKYWNYRHAHCVHFSDSQLKGTCLFGLTSVLIGAAYTFYLSFSSPIFKLI